MGTGPDGDRRPAGARPGGRRPGVLRRLTGGLLIGVGTIFGSKAERDQHWAVPPTMEVVAPDEQAGDDDRSGGRRLPACR